MSRKNLYLSLAVLGALVPWIFFASFFSEHGLGGDFVGSLFVNGAAGGFSSDVLISSLVFWIFLFTEGRRRKIGQLWIYVVVNLLIGLSCALPLFLWSRERATVSSSS